MKRWIRQVTRWELIFLVFLFLAALAIRSTGIRWGLPSQNFKHSTFVFDEPGVLYASLALGEGNYNYLLQNYPFFYYLSFGVFAVYYGLGVLAGHFQGLADFKAQYVLDMSQFLLVGRYFIVLMGSLTVILTYFVARRLFGKITGIVASLFMLLSFGHIVYSKVFRLDSFLPFLFLLTFYLILRLPHAAKKESLRPFVLAGLLLGLTVGTKITGWSLLVPYVLVPFVDADGSLRKRPRLDRRYVFGTYIFFCTYIVMVAPAFRTVAQDALGAVGRLSKEADYIGNPANLSPYRYSIIWHLTRILPQAMGITIYPFSILGLGLLTLDGRLRTIALFVYAALLAYMVPIGYAIRTAWRDMLPVLPLLSIVAAYGLVRASDFAVKKIGWQTKRTVVILGAAGLLLAVPAYNVYQQKQLILHRDTRDLAKDWIQEHVTAGSNVAVQSYGPGIIDETYRRGLVSYVARNSPARRSRIGAEATYDLFLFSEAEGFSGEVAPDAAVFLDFLRSNQIEYVVLSSGTYARYHNEAIEALQPERAARAQEFHDLMATNLVLEKRFVPNWQVRPGPVIQIYGVPEHLHYEGLQPALRGEFEPFPGMERPATAVGYYQFSPR